VSCMHQSMSYTCRTHWFAFFYFNPWFFSNPLI
jgi:hypothetical protein